MGFFFAVASAFAHLLTRSRASFFMFNVPSFRSVCYGAWPYVIIYNLQFSYLSNVRHTCQWAFHISIWFFFSLFVILISNFEQKKKGIKKIYRKNDELIMKFRHCREKWNEIEIGRWARKLLLREIHLSELSESIEC